MNNKTTVEAYVALGSNLGETGVNLTNALRLLGGHEQIEIVKVSDFYKTKPLAGLDQPDYLNAAAKIATSLCVIELLNVLKGIEQTLGRVRADRWCSRIIDLDIVFYGSQIIRTDQIIVPHPQMHLRSFVLEPLSQIEPDFVHPEFGLTVKQLQSRLNGQNFFLDNSRPLLIETAGVIGVGKTTLSAGLVDELNASFICEDYDSNPYLSKVYDGHNELALDSELYFLKSASDQLSAATLRPGHLYIADYIFEKTLIYAEYWLNSSVFAEYMKHYQAQKALRVSPSLVIFIDDSLENCRRRIEKRSRPYENNVSYDMLEKLQDDYRKLMDNWTLSPVIRVDASVFDCTDAQEIKSLACQVRRYVISD